MPFSPERLREARERAKLSQYALSIQAGLSQGHVGLLESGQRPNPAGDTLHALATRLGIAVEDLMAPDPTPEASQ